MTLVGFEGLSRVVGRNTGVFMSGHWRFRVAALLLLAAGLATSPAVSNPLEDLLNPAPKEAAPAPAAPAPVKEACLSRPGSSSAPGHHWFYRLDGHRKCWYQGSETRASVNRQAQRHAVRQAASASDEDEPAPRRKTVADARAQMLSAAPPDASQPVPPAPEVTASADQAPTRVVTAPVVIEPPIHQVTPERAAPRSVDVEMLLADSSLAKDTDPSSAPAAASAEPSALGANEGQWETMATRAGMALITLGFIFLIGSLLVSRFREPRVASSASFLSR